MFRTLITAAAIAIAAPATALAAPVTVTLEGVKDRGGTLYVSVQTEDQFMQQDGIDGVVEENPEAGTRTFTFDLPEGAYAITVWHDDNGNGTFDMGGQYNVPLDGWTMKNALALRGQPTFSDVSISVGDEPVSLDLSMIYGR